MGGPALSELIFAEQASISVSKIVGDLRRSNLSVQNRLRSICEDAGFVQEVAEAFRRPLVANERCGSWYLNPEMKAASAYFKSTDGHSGQWSFSTRRLNLHLLRLIEKNDGCIIVDSTRRGKRMPDALSKTVPIWCCVLNRVLFPAETAAHSLWTPPNVVSPSEHAQIEARLDGFVGSFKQLGFDLDSLRLQISRPLRPFWITPESHLTATEQIFEDFRPVICCTSSRRTLEGESCQGGSYIQGAGDDTENWALGLTAPIFWANKELLMSADEADLPELIASLVKSSTAAHGYKATKLNDYVSVSTLQTEAPEPEDDTCIVRLMPTVSEQKGWIRSKTVMEVGLGNRKIASRNLRHALPTICSFVSKFLETPNGQAAGEEDDRGRILIECETGRDLSIGVALAIMCQCFDDNGKPRNPGTGDGMHFTKEIIRTKLSRIMTTMPDANPSRATLQSVNSFLMG